MNKKMYITLIGVVIFMAVSAICTMLFLNIEITAIILSVIISSALAFISGFVAALNISEKRLDRILDEECDPDKYLYEFTKFHGYKKAEYPINRFNIARLKAFIAKGKFQEAEKALETLNLKSLKKDKNLYVDYNAGVAFLALNFGEIEKAEAYIAELIEIKGNKKCEVIARQLSAEALRIQNNLERARAAFNSLALAKRPKKDVLSGRLAVAYIDKAENYPESAMKNFEIVAREANRLYVRELARNELKTAVNLGSAKNY